MVPRTCALIASVDCFSVSDFRSTSLIRSESFGKPRRIWLIDRLTSVFICPVEQVYIVLYLSICIIQSRSLSSKNFEHNYYISVKLFSSLLFAVIAYGFRGILLLIVIMLRTSVGLFTVLTDHFRAMQTLAGFSHCFANTTSGCTSRRHFIHLISFKQL